jgi:hypothetical protein
MEIQPDFRDLLACFNKHEVEYLVVGGYALALHGAPRLTGDLDLYVRPSPENALRTLAALKEFGFGSLDISADDFTAPDRVIQLGYPPVRVDLVTSISGVSWEEAVLDGPTAQFGDVPARVIGYDAFIRNKKATGRRKDLADIEALGEE